MILMTTLLHRSAAARRAAAATLGLTLLLAACGGNQPGGDGELKVVASFYPLQYLTQRVVGDHAEVVTLTSPSVEPHDLELNVAQSVDVAEADLVVYEKGMQPALDEAVAQNGPSERVEVTEVVELAPADGSHAAESEEEHAEHAGDLHFWLDPERMAEVAAEVSAQMAEVDPEGAEEYAANLATLREELTALDTEYRTGLTDCRLDTVVVSHDAFGYLEKYGLRFEPIAGLTQDAEPSPAHLAELATLIEKEEITTVFSETLASPAMAETLAGELGLGTAVLDPIEGLTDQTADEDYLSLMRANLDALRDANGCR